MEQAVWQKLFSWLDEGRGCAVATVTANWGSAPRQVGAIMIIDDKGNFEGSVSGGCVDGDVVYEALDAMKTGTPRLRDYGITNDQAWQVGLACGGQLEVFIEAWNDSAVSETIKEGQAASKSFVLKKSLVDGKQSLESTESLDRLKSQKLGEHFYHLFEPEPRLIVVGGVHISQALIPMVREFNWGVELIDPRDSYVTEERFPAMSIHRRWPDEVISELKPNPKTAIVALSHDAKLDDPALIASVRSEAGYIGALGSKRSHAKRVERLSEAGVSHDEIEKISAPIGLDIGAMGPQEIAVSILAEIIRTFRGRE